MNIMRTASWAAGSLLGAALLASPALADGMPTSGRVASGSPVGPCTTAGNVGLTSDYVFRGISQSNEHGAVQGGVDFNCGRLYMGVWGSSVDVNPGSGSEVDVYGGYRTKIDRFDIDLGFIYYAYPGDFNDDLSYLEVKAGASTGIWKGGRLGATVFYSPDYFESSGAVTTLEGTFSQTLPRFSIFNPTFSATVGHSFFADDSHDGHHSFDPSYTYWNAGVTLGFWDKWALDLRYWDTNDEGWAQDNPLAGDRVLATLKYSF